MGAAEHRSHAWFLLLAHDFAVPKPQMMKARASRAFVQTDNVGLLDQAKRERVAIGFTVVGFQRTHDGED